MRYVVLGILIMIGSTACGAEPVDGSDPGMGGSTTFDGSWVLISGGGPDGEIPIVDGYRITLTIDGESIGGTSACNQYGGDATIRGSSFAISMLSGTEMGCEPKVMDSEQKYLAALRAIESGAREGDVLTLSGTDAELAFDLVPPVPTAELEDTLWELEALIEGRGPDGVAMSARPATLKLASDGTLSGTTGCRDLSGTWAATGDEVFTPELAADGNCPAGLQSQDGHILEVIGDGFTVQIDGQTLTLFSSRGERGLSYRAAS